VSEALHLELAPLGVHVTIVEPGFFRSDILDHAKSLVEADIRFADYDATAGAVRAFIPQINHNQPGDSVTLAYALIELANAPHPPRACPSVPIAASASPRRTRPYSASASLGASSPPPPMCSPSLAWRWAG
jgi:NAD(P)-dependent dehydrogenase (short-subunit alcohol dehydrogenase family)